MPRENSIYFTFNGIRSDNMHVKLMGIPDRRKPQMKGDVIDVPGRNGALWQPENAYDDIQFTMNIHVLPGADVNAVVAWLDGVGDLSFSTAPAYEYHNVRLTNSIDYKFVGAVSGLLTASIKVQGPPFLYETTESEDIEITTSSYTLSNPKGTIPASPIITVNGSGDVVLTIGTQLIEASGLTDGVIIDGNLMECFNLQRTLLMNSAVSMDDFPTLPTSPVVISWSGNVTSVVIQPRWRWI